MMKFFTLIIIALAVSLSADALGAQTSLTPYQEQQANRFLQAGFKDGDRTFVGGNWAPTQSQYNNYVCPYKPRGTVYLIVKDRLYRSNCN